MEVEEKDRSSAIMCISREYFDKNNDEGDDDDGIVGEVSDNMYEVQGYWI